MDDLDFDTVTVSDDDDEDDLVEKKNPVSKPPRSPTKSLAPSPPRKAIGSNNIDNIQVADTTHVHVGGLRGLTIKPVKPVVRSVSFSDDSDDSSDGDEGEEEVKDWFDPIEEEDEDGNDDSELDVASAIADGSDSETEVHRKSSIFSAASKGGHNVGSPSYVMGTPKGGRPAYPGLRNRTTSETSTSQPGNFPFQSKIDFSFQ
jgi:hypothetical protein